MPPRAVGSTNRFCASGNGTHATKLCTPPSEVSLFHRIGFPLGPSDLAFALNSCGSILNTTGPALRDLAGR